MSKQEQILEVAEQLFNLHGYTAVGVDWIRDSAGVSKTSMYRHFGGKNKLIAAVLHRRHEVFERQLTDCIRAASDKEAKLHALVDWHLAWFESPRFHGCMFMHAVAEFKASDREILDIAKHHKQWLKGLIQECIATTDTTTTSRQAEAMMMLLEGMIVRAEFDDLPKDKNVLRELMLSLAGLPADKALKPLN